MATTMLPERLIDAESETVQGLKHLFQELEKIIEEAETKPEVVHWYHFVPCVGVRYYSYHSDPSPVEPLVRRTS